MNRYSRRAISLVVCSSFLFASRPSVALGVECDISALFVHQSQNNWCWAANMEFVAKSFQCPVDQCKFAEDLYRTLYPGDGHCCENPYVDFCFLVAPDMPQFESQLIARGFTLRDGGFQGGVITPGSLKTAVCSQALPIVALFGPSTGTLGDGHVATIHGVEDSTDPDPYNWEFVVMDPAYSADQIITFKRWCSPSANCGPGSGGYSGGSMFAWVQVTGINCVLVSVGDITRFWYNDPLHQGYQDYAGLVSYTSLNESTNPEDSLALYVSDNPSGPARKVWTIKPLSSPPPEGGTLVSVRHYALQKASPYYYWLDHGSGPFSPVRDPAVGDMRENEDNPIEYTYWLGANGERDILGAPEITQIVDSPQNAGTELTLHWDLSDDDAVLDFYNIYREAVSDPVGVGFQWISSCLPGTSSYCDTTVTAGITYRYKIAAAHHGASGGAVSGANKGIWNDFSEVVEVTPVNDLPIISSYVRKHGTSTLTPISASHAVGCPAGDADEVVVEVFVEAVGGGSLPAEALTLSQPTSSSLAFFPDGLTIHADSAGVLVPNGCDETRGYFRTTFTVGALGGCASDSALVSLYDAPLGYAHLNIRSPDILIGAGTRAWVGLGDFGEFGSHYQSSVCNCVYSNDYSACADFVLPDTAVTSGDLGFFGAHYQHGDPTGGGNPAPAQMMASAGSVRLEFIEEQPLFGPHKLAVKIDLENIEPFEAMVIALANENSVLSFLEWTPSTSFPGRTMAVTTRRDGQKQLFVGVLGSKNAPSGDGFLGTAVFVINSDEPVSLSEGDFALVTADVMEIGGRILQVSPDGRQVTYNAPDYRNELAQNYPNPFNPRTTIAFSLAAPSETQLRVFDVRGASVRTLVNGRREAGLHRVDWDGRTDAGQPVASGVYFCKLVAGSFSDTKKMVILR